MAAAPLAPSPAAPPPALRGPGRALAPVDQVATLLLAMGKPAAGRLLKYFEPDEIKRITRSAVQLGAVSPDQLDGVVESFAVEFANGASLVGTVQEVEKLLSGLIPAEQLAELLADVRGNGARSVWERMASASESVLASYLVKEHPQTAALILSRIKPAVAAKVMSQLPAPLRNTLMRRMLNFKPVDDEILSMLEKTLLEDFISNGTRNSGADTHAKMADIINKMDRAQMDEALTSLGESRPKSVEILKGCSSPSTTSSSSRPAPAPPCSTPCRTTASSWPSRARRPSSAASSSRRCRPA